MAFAGQDNCYDICMIKLSFFQYQVREGASPERNIHICSPKVEYMKTLIVYLQNPRVAGLY